MYPVMFEFTAQRTKAGIARCAVPFTSATALTSMTGSTVSPKGANVVAQAYGARSSPLASHGIQDCRSRRVEFVAAGANVPSSFMPAALKPG